MTSAPSHLNTVIKNSSQGAVVVAQLAKAVAFYTKGPLFESRHQQSFYWILFTVNCIEKKKIKKKWLGMAHFLKKNSSQNDGDTVS